MDAWELADELGISYDEAIAYIGNANVAAGMVGQFEAAQQQAELEQQYAAQAQAAYAAQGGPMDESEYEAYLAGYGQDLSDMGYYQDYSYTDPSATDATTVVYPSSDPVIEQLTAPVTPDTEIPGVPSVNWDYYGTPVATGNLPDVSAQIAANESAAQTMLEGSLNPGGSAAELISEMPSASPSTPEEANAELNDLFGSLEDSFAGPTPSLPKTGSSASAATGSGFGSGFGIGSSSPNSSASKSPAASSNSGDTTTGLISSILGAVSSIFKGSTPTTTTVGAVKTPAQSAISTVGQIAQADVLGMPLWVLLGGGIAAWALFGRGKSSGKK